MSKIRIPTPLRHYTQGKDELEVSGATVHEALKNLEQLAPGIGSRICDDKGEPRRFVNIFINEIDIRQLQGSQSPVKPTDIISIVPAIAGGTPKTPPSLTSQELLNTSDTTKSTLLASKCLPFFTIHSRINNFNSFLANSFKNFFLSVILISASTLSATTLLYTTIQVS
jgi:molybdopterin converting factor small subunit